MIKTTILTMTILIAGVFAPALNNASVFATTNIVTNGSFETVDASVTCDPPGFHTVSSGTTITGWTVGGLGGIDWICGYWLAQDGAANLDMSGLNPLDGPGYDPIYDGSPSDAGSISQDLATFAGATYSGTFYMSGNTDGGSPALKTMTVTADAIGVVNSPFTHNTIGKGTD